MFLVGKIKTKLKNFNLIADNDGKKSPSRTLYVKLLADVKFIKVLVFFNYEC